MEKLLVFTEKRNSRINYIFAQLFVKILKLNFELTTNINEFNSFKGPKISYSEKRTGNEILIKPHGILHENEIKKQQIRVTEWEGIKIFYQVDGDADLPFDIFSASFFLISRYEEYLPYSKEKYDRFEAKESLAYKNNFLEEPIVEKWMLKLEQKLKTKFPGMEFPERNFSFQSTIDIDNPYAFLHKGFFRTTGALLKSFIRLDIKTLISRILTIKGSRKDPFDTYGYIHKIEKKYGFRSIYFFLVGDYGRHDTNIPIQKPAYQNLILDIHKSHRVGLHSSFNSNKSFNRLLKEKKRLTKVINEPIVKNRQHYLILKMPYAYQKLIEAGIKEDYSMGFASSIGFRAGTCTPFTFYDLTKEEETGLVVHPFQVMEVTLHSYLQLKSHEAPERIKKIIDEVKAVNGHFVSLWHNESLSELGIWTGWRKVFEDMFKECVTSNQKVT